MGLAGMLFFLWQLPVILLQANFESISPVWRSLGCGWYLSMLGTALMLLGAFLREPIGDMTPAQNVSNNQPTHSQYDLQEEPL